jgi:RNA polymerase sigma factor (sigma-70 family)
MSSRAEPADARRAELSAALARVAAGDRAAMRLVYERSSAKLYGICLRICQDREIAADIMQEAYIKIWNRAGRFDPERASPITWLATIARNSAIDWVRAQKAPTVELDDAPEIADERPLAPELIEAAQGDARIAQCLDALGGNAALAIRRAFFDGLSYPQLAEKMAVPLGTMKSWIRRGLLSLKECLGDG